MTDSDALLAAILADPADDTARLMYADWLDENATGDVKCRRCDGTGWRGPIAREIAGGTCPTCSSTGRVSNGYAERAEFIRVQCELARHTKYIHGIKCHDVEVAELLGREREVWPKESPAKRKEWFGLSHLEIEVARGFTFKVICPWSDWLAHADAIRARQPIERVTLTTFPDWEYYIDRYHGNEIAKIKAIVESDWPGIAFELPARRFADEAEARRQRDAGVLPVGR